MEKDVMSPERLKSSLAITDLSVPDGGHAVSLLVARIKNFLEKKYVGVQVCEYRDDPIVLVKENFDDLLFPEDNLGRSSRYTRYVSEEKVLRTHTSAGIPRWLREEAQRHITDTIVLLPGICYRRDVVDKIHSGEPHQMDIWRIKKGSSKLQRKDFIDLIEGIIYELLPGCIYRVNEVKHPYTINGLEVEIFLNGSWLEILEGGEVHPVILKNFGFDPENYSGLALGMGLDRLVMSLKGIEDIRILRSEDSRIKSQLSNLDPFIPVSRQPSTTRILSFATSVGNTEEDMCEKIRDGLKENAVYLEKIEYSEIPYEELTEKAKTNLGVSPNQKNAIVTITFRALTKSLSREMVNDWVKTLYPLLNEGVGGYL